MAYAQLIGPSRITLCRPRSNILQFLLHKLDLNGKEHWKSFRNVPTFRNLSRSSPSLTSQISSSEIPELADLEEKGYHFNTHQELYNFSLQNPGAFWSTFARSRLKWAHDFHETSDCNFVEGKVNWFSGGKLNVSGLNPLFRGTGCQVAVVLVCSVHVRSVLYCCKVRSNLIT